MIWLRDLKRLDFGIQYIGTQVSDHRKTWVPHKRNQAEAYAFLESLHAAIEAGPHAYSYTDYITSGRQADTAERDDFAAQAFLDEFDLKLGRRLINWTKPVSNAFESAWADVEDDLYGAAKTSDMQYGGWFNLDQSHPLPVDGERFYEPGFFVGREVNPRWRDPGLPVV